MNIPQSVANPARTGLQMGGAAILVEFWDAFVTDLSDQQYAALVALLTLALGVAQNAYEAYKGKYLLKPNTVTLKQR